MQATAILLLLLASAWLVDSSCKSEERKQRLGRHMLMPSLRCGETKPICPKRMQRVYGGSNVCPGQHPYMVGLYSSSDKSFVCGGVIIGKRHILTTANCVHEYSADEIYAVAGSIYRGANDGIVLQVKTIKIHESFDPEVKSRDIALLTTTEPMKFQLTNNGTQTVNPVCLPDGDTIELEETGPLITSGWGKEDVGSKEYAIALLTHKTLIYRHYDCKAFLTRKYVRTDLTDKVCTIYTNRASCSGDEGGPLVDIVNGKHVLLGLLSVIPDQCDLGLPAIHTNVAHHLRWIGKYMRA